MKSNKRDIQKGAWITNTYKKIKIKIKFQKNREGSIDSIGWKGQWQSDKVKKLRNNTNKIKKNLMLRMKILPIWKRTKWTFKEILSIFRQLKAKSKIMIDLAYLLNR